MRDPACGWRLMRSHEQAAACATVCGHTLPAADTTLPSDGDNATTRWMSSFPAVDIMLPSGGYHASQRWMSSFPAADVKLPSGGYNASQRRACGCAQHASSSALVPPTRSSTAVLTGSRDTGQASDSIAKGCDVPKMRPTVEVLWCDRISAAVAAVSKTLEAAPSNAWIAMQPARKDDVDGYLLMKLMEPIMRASIDKPLPIASRVPVICDDARHKRRDDYSAT